MLTAASWLYFGLAGFGFASAFGYGISSGHGSLMHRAYGVVTLGFKGPVGEHFGYVLLLTLGVVAAFVGLLTIAFGDADVEEGPSEAEATEATEGPRPSPSAWPLVAAFVVAAGLLGLVVEAPIVILAAIGLVIVAVEWTVQAWADGASTDPVYNRNLRNRVMLPLEIPMLAVIGITAVVVAVSRVFLALTATGAVVAATVVSALLLAVAILLTTRPRVSSTLLSVLLLIGGVSVLGGGIVSAAVGERDFHAAGEEAEEHEEGEGRPPPPGDGPLVVVADNLEFIPTELEARAGEELVIELDNRDRGIPHNIHVLDVEDAVTPLEQGPHKDRLELTIEEEGDYEYICDVHPTTMTGTLTIS